LLSAAVCLALAFGVPLVVLLGVAAIVATVVVLGMYGM
jgi:hypothetical protein